MRSLVLLFIGLFSLGFQCFGQFTVNEGNCLSKNYYEEISYEKVNGKLIIPFTISGTTYRFLLDTGAPMLISSELQKKLQYDAYVKVPVSDQSGKSDSMSFVYMQEMQLGNIKFDSIPAIVADNPLLECYQIDGFVGSNLLRHVILQFDDPNSKIILTDQLDRLDHVKSPASDLFLDPTQSGPYLRVQLKKLKKANEQLLFDSGMNGLYDMATEHYHLFKEKVNIFKNEEKGFGNNSLGLHGAAADAENIRAVIPKVNIGSGQLNNVAIQTTTDDNSRLGSELLEYGVVTLDFINRKFYFSPFEEKIDLGEGQFPINPTYHQGKFVVGIIWEEKLMEEMSIGDPILTINGKDYSDKNLCELVSENSIFSNQDVKTLHLVYKHQGEEKEITIHRK